MHRHGYQGRKLHRERDQRKALIKGLADSLVKYETIETTLPKAREVVPYVEKLITKAKKGDLHSRRQVIRGLSTLESAHKLVDELAPRMTGRTSGHLRIKPSVTRRGDNAQLAIVSFVDEAKPVAKTEKAEEPKAKASPKPAAPKKAAAKPAPSKRKPTPAGAKS
ncbi:MAG TPA: 50S ribosomal protein L17 [Candidatus Saccharimonadales bacterium]|jgi:large subunit ribosomal protein L17